MPRAIDREVHRGVSWVGFATSAVSILDIVAILLLLKFWISPSDYGIATKTCWMFYILDTTPPDMK